VAGYPAPLATRPLAISTDRGALLGSPTGDLVRIGEPVASAAMGSRLVGDRGVGKDVGRR
jgi:hypothetical protein